MSIKRRGSGVKHNFESDEVGDPATMAPDRQERRNAKPGGVRREPSPSQLTAMILGTYAEMP